MSRQQVITLINYIAQAGEAQDVQTLLFGLAQRVPQHGETLMTFAEHMKQIGLAEGIQEGKRAAMLEIARAMLQRGFNSSTVTEITGLSKDELQQLPH
ncbi:Rpn family recombination-promoting nuclease/putative transposase [Pseudescherichia sp.]